MKILAIRGSNLASIAGEFAIELGAAPLATAGVFAIIGNTGAGKSTLLDAMCLALFDRMPRLALRSSVVIGRSDDEANQLGAADVRGILRRGATAGYAEVDFESDDRRRYRARWSVRRARGKSDGALQGQELGLTALDTGEVLGGKKTETLVAIRQRLGLSFDQFRRSVLLAQGDFAAFLRADGKERSELLERMTGTQIYSTISKLAHAQASERVRQQQDIRTTVAALACLDDAARTALLTQLTVQQSALQQTQQHATAVQQYIEWQQRGERLVTLRSEGKQQLDVAAAQQRAAQPQRAQLELLQMAEAHRASWRQLGDAEARGTAATARMAQRQQQLQQAASQREQLAAIAVALDQASSTLQAALQVDVAATKVIVADYAAATSHAQRATTALQAQKQRVALTAAWPTLDAGLPRAALLRSEHTTCGNKLLAAKADLVKIAAEAKLLGSQMQQAEQAVELAKREAATYDKRRTTTPETGRRNEDLARRRVSDIEALAAVRTAAVNAESAGAALQERAATLAAEQQAHLVDAAAQQQAAAQLTASLDEAQRALQSMRDVASLAHHRAALVTGEPCPLCGATKHPWAKRTAIDDAIVAQQTRVDELLAQQQQQQQAVGKLEAMQRVAQKNTAQVAAELAALRVRADELTTQWANAHVELGVLQLVAAPTDAAAADWLTSQLAAAQTGLQQARAERERAEKAAQAATEAIGIVTARQLTVTELQQRHNQLDVQRTALTVAIDNDTARQAQLARELTALWSTLEPHLLALKASTQHSNAAAITGVHTQLGALWQQCQAAVRDATSCAANLAGHRDLLLAETAALAEREAGINAALASDDDEAQRCTVQAGELREALHSVAAQHAVSFEQLVQLFATPSQAAANLAQQLAALAQAEVRAQEVFDERDRAWREHQQAAPARPSGIASIDAGGAEPTAPELAALQTRLLLALEDQQRDYDGLRSELAVDESARSRRDELNAQLGAAEQNATTIAALAAAIGSHDGKIFRAFAQGLTLDALLEQANHHLLGLAPRYALERVPAQDLEVQVVDRDMGDEIRGVASLSGGESFLISLALALGLSSLAAHSVRVQSLFIDEGFGTLDPATLDTALAVLDNLQSSGRQVGIISHVPAIAERVGATVNVINLGAGRSRVAVG